MSGHEGEGRQQLALLSTPALAQLMIAHEHLLSAFVEPRIDVKSDVITPQKIDGEPCGETNIHDTLVVATGHQFDSEMSTHLHFSIGLHLTSNGQHQLIINATRKIHVEGHHLRNRNIAHTIFFTQLIYNKSKILKVNSNTTKMVLVQNKVSLFTNGYLC